MSAITRNLKYIFIIAIFIAGIAGYALYNDSRNNVPEAKAAAADNFLLGFAWSNNIGWISFNSKNCNPIGAGSSGVGGCPLPVGAPIPNYSVNVDIASVGELSGFAWSENIGWISFDKTVTGTPPGAPYDNNLQNYIAKLDSSNNLTGWARAISACKDTLWNGVNCTGSGAGDKAGGWDGWIKLRSNAPVYGVTLNALNEFEGFAWGDMVAGWISFNCSSMGACSAINNYKVYLSGNPYAENFTGTIPSYCNKPAQFSLQWTYRNIGFADQDQYHIQVATDALFSSIVLDTTINQSVAPGNQGSAALRVVSAIVNPLTDILYAQTYYLQLQVHAVGGGSTWSNWLNYNDSSDSDGDGSTDSFSTPPHEYPDVGFAPPEFGSSPSFLINMPISFKVSGNPVVGPNDNDNTKCYPASDNTDCKQWVWDFDYVSPTFTSDKVLKRVDGDNGNTTHSYALSNPAYKVVLQVTDNDDYTCIGSSEILGIKKATWKEVIPDN